MSIQPFFRDEPYLRDDLADTRKDAVTFRPDDDLCDDNHCDDNLCAVDTPPTYAMGLAERLAALHHPDARPSSVEIVLRTDALNAPFELTTITLEDLDLNETLEDFDPNADFDRKTLPSAPYPPAILDDSTAAFSWDVLPAPLPSFPDSTEMPWEPPSDPTPSEETHSLLQSSLWGKLQKFVTGISSKPRSQPPVSSSSFRRLSQRAMFEIVWTYDNAALDALSSHIERILAVRRLGPEAYAESRIVDMLDNMLVTERCVSDGIGISILRARIPEVARPMFDHALLRLENRGIVTLVPDDLPHDAGFGAKGAKGDPQPQMVKQGYDGIFDPVRGHLNRCILLQPAS